MTDTFDPEGNGWSLQRGYKIVPGFLVAEDQRELGNVTSTAIFDKPFRRIEGLRYRCDTRDAFEYMDSFFLRLKGPVARFYYQWPEFVSTPDKAPTLEAVVSGAQAERTITVRFAWRNSLGTTRASATGSLLIPVNNLIKVTLPTYPANITQAVIYAAQGAPGSEQEQTVLTTLRTWTQPDAPLLTGTSSPATTNSCREMPLCKLVAETLDYTRGDGTTYEASLSIEEVAP